MYTKLKGDVAEQAVILKALKQGWGVSVPIGDRHTYDLVFDIHKLRFRNTLGRNRQAATKAKIG